jgi:hypothetical protein
MITIQGQQNLETKRQKWLNGLKGGIEITDENRKWIDQEVRRVIKEKGSCKRLEGIFGDEDRCDGFEEEIIHTTDGAKTKIIGCSFLLNGFIDKDIIDHVAVVKRVWIEDIKLMTRFPFLIPIFLSQKGLRRYALISYAHLIQLKYPFPFWKIQDSDFSLPIKELVKGLREATQHLKQDKFVIYNVGEVVRYTLDVLIDSVALVFFADNAYLFPLQDILSQLDKKKLGQNLRKEVNRLLDIGISRANHIHDKLKLFKLFINFLLFFPQFRKIVRIFLETINPANIEMDGADFYFSLKRRGYNYGGLSFEERLKIREELDKTLGHHIL